MASVISNLPMFQGASGNVSFDNLASRQVLTHTMHTTTHAWQALHSTVCVYSVHTHKHTHTHIETQSTIRYWKTYNFFIKLSCQLRIF